jgi:hypothetical protein
MPKRLKIPISAIAKLSKNISRPTLYKILRTKKDILNKLLEKEKELATFYDKLFADYKKDVYSNRIRSDRQSPNQNKEILENNMESNNEDVVSN